MNTRKWLITSGIALLAMLVTLALATGLTQAQEPGPEEEVQPQSETDVTTIAPGAIPIQGRLTDASGNPLDGVYDLTFRLYDVASGGAYLCSDTNSVTVDNGLFSSYMDYCYDDLYGQKVWLAVKVGSDPEMTPRQVVFPVPYALSLKPVAVISYSHSSPILTIRNYGSGTGVTSFSQDGYGVYSTSGGDDAAVYGFNNMEGNGVEGYSNAGAGVVGGSFAGVGVQAGSSFGVALKATGTGIIQSTADTEIAVSPLKMVAQNNSSDIEFRADGAYMEVRPVASGSETVYIPVDLPSELFGTATKLESARICYRCDTTLSFIDTTFVRYSTDSGTFGTLINNTTNRTSDSWGCYTVTDSTPDEIPGSLFLQFTLSYAGTGSAHDIRIGNITLTLTEE